MKNFKQYFHRPDFVLMRSLEPYSSSGALKDDSIAKFESETLPSLILHIMLRDVILVHIPTGAAENTATILQELLAEQGITCPAITALPRGWQADRAKIENDVIEVHLGKTPVDDKILILVGSEGTLTSFCRDDDSCDIPGYGEIIGQSIHIEGHW